MKKLLHLKKSLKGVFVLVLFLHSACLISQNIKISGKITDTSGTPLMGVNVIETGTSNGTVSNGDGIYSLVANTNATIQFSYIGYVSQSIKLGESSTLDIKMLESTESLDEVIISTGYIGQRKADLTGAVSVVNMEGIRNIPTSNPMQALQGQVPGLYIQTDGNPSGDNSQILIRGFSTLGDNNPLYVIDGVPTKRAQAFKNLNPQSIESIQILKDASSSSIYGSRASNGVIIVTTKESKGQEKLNIQYDGSVSIQKYSSSLPVLNTKQRGEALWRASINDGTNPNIHSALYNFDWHTDNQGVPILDQVNVVDWIGGESLGVRSADTNWQDVVFRDAIMTSHDLTITSGSEKSSMLFNVGYFDNEGLARYTDFKRYSARINTSTKLLNGKLKIGENFQLAKSVETPTPSDLGGASVIQMAKFLQPIIPVYDVNGEFAGPPIGAGFSDRNNPLHMLYINKDDKNHRLEIFGNVYAELALAKNLTFRSSFGIDNTNGYNRNIERSFTEGFLSRTINSLSINKWHGINLTFSNTLNYRLSHKSHNLDIVIGTEKVDQQFLDNGVYREEFALQDDDYFQIGAGTGRTTATGSETGSKLFSYFGKVNYDFDKKYFGSFTIRRDGSSRFGENNRYGLFPAASLGWKISNEEFMGTSKEIISDLKIRAGFGVVGNQDIGDYARFALYETNYGGSAGRASTGTAYPIAGQNSGNLPSGFVSLQAENKNLKWETSEELNIGLDFGFLNQTLTGSLDIFKRETRDILIRPPYPSILGEGKSQWVNGATNESKGFELMVNYQKSYGDFNYSVTGNLAKFKDEITYLPQSVVRSYAGNVEKTILGRSQTALFGYITDGIFQNQAEVDAHANQPGKGIGRLRYVDLNNDNVINSLDQDWLGDQLPDFTYGINLNLSYKNWSISTFFQGVAGLEVPNGIKSATDFVGSNSGTNYGLRTLSAWTPQNTASTIPALSLVNRNDETRRSNYNIEDASYLKLRNLEIGYDLTNIVGKFGINSMRIYMLGQNLFTLQKDEYTGPDPENPGNLYPRPTTYTLGINISL
ncbi:SusC/RagA family TonB-linked outer membrane protein [Confluentibacter flavum]|nr:TonB-dependent receptor [Confluentibacter flavum]